MRRAVSARRWSCRFPEELGAGAWLFVEKRPICPGDAEKRPAMEDRQGALVDRADEIRNPVAGPLFETLKAADIRQVGYVPDAGHARLIERCKADPDIRDVVLTAEEEGVAIAAGAWLGGQRAALLMQSSGVGNCINMLSLDPHLPFSDADAGDDARRVGGVQSVAGADGFDSRADAQALRHPRVRAWIRRRG